MAIQPNIHVGDANRDGRDDLVAFNPAVGVNKWQVALSQQAANGANSFVLATAQADGTNDWDRWFKDWDWGPAAAPYKFLNVDAPYQHFLDVFSGVYNNVELELYPGLMKGIEATAQTKAGNDWDQAALLVDRLEPDVNGPSEGQRAKIATGKVLVEPSAAKEWIGTTTAGAALNIISASLDGGADASNGEYRFKHAWVRALVPTIDGMKWIDVDPSWKFKDRQPSETVDLTNVAPGTNGAPGYTPPTFGIAGRDTRGTYDEFGYLANGGTSQLPVEWYEDQVMKYLVDTGKNKSLADVPYDGPIIQKQFDAIPVGWNGDVTFDNPVNVETFANFAEIANSQSLSARLTHRATVSIERERANVGIDINPDIAPDFLPATALRVSSTSAINWYPAAVPGDFTVQPGPIYVLNGTQFIAIRISSSGYTITPNTRIRFDFNGTFQGAVDPDIRYTLGLDNDGPGANPPTFNGSAGEKYDTFDIHPQGQGYYERGSGTKVLDIPVASFLGYSTAVTMEYVVFGLWDKDGDQVPSNAAHAFISNIALYENDNTSVVNGSTIRQVDSATAEISLGSTYTVTNNTRLEFEFKSGSQGSLHAIGWDDNGSEPSKRYKLYGNSAAPAGYGSATPSDPNPTGDGYLKFSIPIGSYLTGGNTAALERLLFITGAGTNPNAESLFRNVSFRENGVASEVHLTDPLVVPAHSLDSISVDYVKQLNSPGTTADDTYSAKLTLKNAAGVTNTIYATAGKYFYAGDDAIIHIQHSSPSDFGIAIPEGVADNRYHRKPGQIHAIGFDANQYSIQQIVGLQAEINSALADGASVADIDELLTYTSAKYWYELNRGDRTIDGLLRTVGGEQWVGSGIVTSDPYLLTDSIPGLNGGTPVYTADDLKHLQFPILPYNMGVDLPNTNHASFNIATGATNDEAFQLGGYNASALENAILEEVVDSQSISTIRGLRNAFNSSNAAIWVYESVWEGGQRKIYQRGSISGFSSGTTYNPTGGIVQSSGQVQAALTSSLDPHSDVLADSVVAILENRNNLYGGANSQRPSVYLSRK